MNDNLRLFLQYASSTYVVFYGALISVILFVCARRAKKMIDDHPQLIVQRQWHFMLIQIAKLLENSLRKYIPPFYASRVHTWLKQSGESNKWSMSHFVSYQVCLLSIALVLGGFLFSIILGLPILLSIVLAVAAFSLPIIQLTDKISQRLKSSNRDLPELIDYLALSMDAGLDLSQGLDAVIADAPPSPVANEFARLARNMRLGMSREDAFMDMQTHLPTAPVRSFCQTMEQAFRVGSDIVQSLYVMAETLRSERFQNAEEQAGKISVRMMLPLMVFVLPATVIILIGPFALEWFTRM